MKFSDIPGLDDVKAVLLQSVQNNHVAHAQLFAGRQGGAALPLAIAYAAFVNCTARTDTDSCGACSSCRQFAKHTHPDLHFVFPVSTTDKVSKSSDAVSGSFYPEWRAFLLENPYAGLADWAETIGSGNKQCSISREESRNIMKMVSLKAFSAEYKVVLVWLAEQMHTAASNAILKILEEPSPKTLFLLVVNQLDKVMPTILSRTQITTVRPFSEAESVAYLESKGIAAEKALYLSNLCEGDLNKALKLSEDLKDDNFDFFTEWMRMCYGGDFSAMIDKADVFSGYAKDAQKNFLLYSLSMFRETMAYKYAGADRARLPENALAFVKKFSVSIQDDAFEHYYKLLNSAVYHLERNANVKIIFFDLSIQFRYLMRGR